MRVVDRVVDSPQVSPEAQRDTAVALGILPRKCLLRHEGTLRLHFGILPRKCLLRHEGTLRLHSASPSPQVSPEAQRDTAVALGILPRKCLLRHEGTLRLHFGILPRKCLLRHEGTLRLHSASPSPQVSPEAQRDTAVALGILPR